MMTKTAKKAEQLEITVCNEPLPPSMRGRHSIYNFGALKVGEGLKIKTANLAVIASVRSAAYRYGKAHNVKLTTRLFHGGVGVWRTA